MPPVRFEPTISAGERQQTYALRPRGHWDRPSINSTRQKFTVDWLTLMLHDEKRNGKYRYAGTEFTLCVLRVRIRRRNTTIERYSPFIYICFPQYASTFLWPAVDNSFLAHGAEREKKEMRAELQNNPNYYKRAKTLSCYESLLQIFLVASATRQKKYSNLCTSYKYRYCHTSGIYGIGQGPTNFPKIWVTERWHGGSSMLRTHICQARSPEFVYPWCRTWSSCMHVTAMHDARH